MSFIFIRRNKMSQRGNTPLFPLDVTQRLMTEQRLYRTTSAQVTHTIERNANERNAIEETVSPS